MKNTADTHTDLPHSIEAELGLLACCLIGHDARERVLSAKIKGIKPNAFFEVKHQIIFENLIDLLQDESPIDTLLLLDRLEAKGLSGQVEGWAGLESIASRIDTPASFNRYLKIVASKWKQRRIIRESRKLIEAASMPGNSFENVRELIQEPLTEIGTLSSQEAEVGAGDEIDQLTEQKHLEFSGESQEVPEAYRVHIGMPRNAELLGWVDRRETDNYIVIGAPSSRGKSTFMRQIENWNLVKHPDWKIAVFLMEGGRRKHWHSLACSWAGIPNRKHFDWTNSLDFDPDRKQQYFDHLDYLKTHADERLFVFEQDQSIAQIEARCKELDARLGGLDLVIVDYIQAIQSGKTGVNREQQISHISSRLRTLQVSLGCPLITGSQLNRDGEARESAQIFNDSTRFWRITRPEKDLDGRDQWEEGRSRYFQTLEQIKNRNGETCRVGYTFNTACGTFCDLKTAQSNSSNVVNF